MICDRQDYDWSCMKVDELGLQGRVARSTFSPSQGQLPPAQLAEWILHDKLKRPNAAADS